MTPNSSGATLVQAIERRQEEIVERLVGDHGDLLAGRSRLPGWDRLTIMCHLRYGASASRRMTTEALAERTASFYPQGRARQRPSTLCPADGESASDVIASFEQESLRLTETWMQLDEQQWKTTAIEPADNVDLGPISLWTVALLRLTEVEVHGHDLDLDLSQWSKTFVETALPMRLRWLPTRRSNHQDINRPIDGKWAIAATDGPTFLVTAQGPNVEVAETKIVANADATIAGTADQLLAFILGRRSLEDLEIRGDLAVAHSFLEAFPAP